MRKVINKMLAVILTMVCCISPLTVFASTNEGMTPPATLVGYLKDENGESITVEGHLVSTPQLLSDEYSATYEYDLYSTSNSLTSNEKDSKKAVQAYITIKYKTNNSSPTGYLLTGVSGYWTILKTGTSVTSASLTYGCSGFLPTPTTQNKTIAVSNHFSYTTGFTKYVVPDYGAMGANLTLKLKQGSTTWSFFMINNLFG
ncbi:MAG: hypothetical protein KH355_09565 [Clostridiales bacterium]|nr:hypothetical protein [Clostridiales bacterium]